MNSASLAIAPSNPSPASTLTASRSSASGSAAPTSSFRWRILIVEQPVGREEAAAGERDDEEEPGRPAAGGAEHQRQQDAGDDARALQCEETGRGQPAAHAGREDLELDGFEARARVDLQHRAGDPVAQRPHHALLEVRRLRPDRQPQLAVASGALHRELPLPARQRDDLADQVDGAAETHQRKDQQHCLITP